MKLITPSEHNHNAISASDSSDSFEALATFVFWREHDSLAIITVSKPLCA